jgi:HSP20 family protein
MAIVHWTQFPEVDRLQRQMNRLFEDTIFGDLTNNNNFIQAPLAEIEEKEESLILKLEVPGMEAKDLDIEVTKNSVSIRGERKQEQKTEENGLTRSEFRYGKFERVIPLQVHINNNNVNAEYKDGILKLTLPKAEEEKNKVVKVNLR